MQKADALADDGSAVGKGMIDPAGVAFEGSLSQVNDHNPKPASMIVGGGALLGLVGEVLSADGGFVHEPRLTHGEDRHAVGRAMIHHG